MLLLVVLPSFNQRGDASLLMNLQKRMVKLQRPVIALVVLTGLLALRRAVVGSDGEGLPPAYLTVLIIKIIVTLAMIGLAVRRQWWLHKYAYSRPRMGMLLLVVNTALGWSAMLLSGVLSALGDAGL
jgi:hypothetical protein